MTETFASLCVKTSLRILLQFLGNKIRFMLSNIPLNHLFDFLIGRGLGIIRWRRCPNLEIGSDNLTTGVRSFVVTGDIVYLQNYFTEAYETRHRDGAIQDLETMISRDSTAYEHLTTALALSNELMNDEYLAMKLVLSTGDYDESLIPEVLRDLELSPEDAAKSPQEKRAQALDLVYGDRYADYKARIWENADLCTQELIKTADEERVRLNDRMDRLLGIQTSLTVGMVLVVLVIVVFIIGWIRMPLLHMVKKMRAKELVSPNGRVGATLCKRDVQHRF